MYWWIAYLWALRDAAPAAALGPAPRWLAAWSQGLPRGQRRQSAPRQSKQRRGDDEQGDFYSRRAEACIREHGIAFPRKGHGLDLGTARVPAGWQELSGRRGRRTAAPQTEE